MDTFKSETCFLLTILKEQIRDIEGLLNVHEKARFLLNKSRDLEDTTCKLRNHIWDQHAKEERAAGNKLFQ
jgi:hypothetical protein